MHRMREGHRLRAEMGLVARALELAGMDLKGGSGCCPAVLVKAGPIQGWGQRVWTKRMDRADAGRLV